MYQNNIAAQGIKQKEPTTDLENARKFQSLNPLQVLPNFTVHLADLLMNPTSQPNLGTTDLQLRHLELRFKTILQEAQFVSDQINAIKMIEKFRKAPQQPEESKQK